MKKRAPNGRDANTDTPRMSASRQRFYAMSGKARPWWLGSGPTDDSPTRVRVDEEQTQKVLANPKSD